MFSLAKRVLLYLKTTQILQFSLAPYISFGVLARNPFFAGNNYPDLYHFQGCVKFATRISPLLYFYFELANSQKIEYTFSHLIKILLVRPSTSSQLKYFNLFWKWICLLCSLFFDICYSKLHSESFIIGTKPCLQKRCCAYIINTCKVCCFSCFKRQRAQAFKVVLTFTHLHISAL